MSVQRIEKLIWPLIYGGLLAMCLGWFLSPLSGPWGEMMTVGGLFTVVGGVILIVVRSRMKG